MGSACLKRCLVGKMKARQILPAPDGLTPNRVSPAPVPVFFSNPGLLALDINDDGKMDLVQQWNNGGILWLMSHVVNGPAADLLISITNGLGEQRS